MTAYPFSTFLGFLDMIGFMCVQLTHVLWKLLSIALFFMTTLSNMPSLEPTLELSIGSTFISGKKVFLNEDFQLHFLWKLYPFAAHLPFPKSVCTSLPPGSSFLPLKGEEWGWEDASYVAECWLCFWSSFFKNVYISSSLHYANLIVKKLKGHRFYRLFVYFYRFSAIFWTGKRYDLEGIGELLSQNRNILRDLPFSLKTSYL